MDASAALTRSPKPLRNLQASNDFPPFRTPPILAVSSKSGSIKAIVVRIFVPHFELTQYKTANEGKRNMKAGSQSKGE